MTPDTTNCTSCGFIGVTTIQNTIHVQLHHIRNTDTDVVSPTTRSAYR